MVGMRHLGDVEATEALILLLLNQNPTCLLIIFVQVF